MADLGSADMTPPMDRDELIARLQYILDADGKEYVARISHLRPHDLRRCLAALESRPAPTEEHDDRIALETLSAAMKEVALVRDETKFSDDVPASERNALRNGATACWVMLNGMQGAILKRYPLGLPNRFATDTTPSRDEEGSVDREDALAHWLATAEKHKLMVASKPGRADWPATEAVIDALMTFAALKASTPETQIGEGGGRAREILPGDAIEPWSAQVAAWREEYGVDYLETEMAASRNTLARWEAGPSGPRPSTQRALRRMMSDVRRERNPDTPKPTTPERAKALEEAARVADKRAKAHAWSFSRAVEFKNDEHQTRFAVAAREAEEIATAIRALSASPIEVEK